MSEPSSSAAKADVWPRLQPFNVFEHFTDQQREGFLRAYAREAGMRVKAFRPGEILCHKGEYELDLCFILQGSVDLFDLVPGEGRVKVRSLAAGDHYGELGAFSGMPRTTDIVAGADGSEVFYLPRYLLKLVLTNTEARALLNDRYRERAVRVMAKELDIFKGVAPQFIDRLIAASKIEDYDQRGILIVKQGDKGDAFYIVRDGFVQVVHDDQAGVPLVLAYLRSGDYFGEMALLGAGSRYATVRTAGKCELLKIPAADFLALCKEYPGVEAGVRETIERRHHQETQITPEVSGLLDTSGRLGVIQGDALLVMNLDLCVKCDQCVKACEDLHGVSRLIRTGIQIDRYLVPAACRHCGDPKCMNSCPTGAIKRRPEGEIYFQYDMCIGCGNCAIACPFDNIAMIETAKFDQAQARKTEVIGDLGFFRPYPVPSHAVEQGLWSRIFARHESGDRERLEPSLWQRILGRNAAPQAAKPEEPHTGGVSHIPPVYPIKCDLCDGLPFMGCVHSCPTGAAIRIDPATLFEKTGALSMGQRVRKAHGGSD